MTRRASVLAVTGLAAAAAIAATFASLGRSDIRATASPSWGFYNSTEWAALQSRIAARGFRRDSVHVVGGLTRQRTSRPFALLAAERQDGRTCFVPVNGVTPGRAVCQLDRPVFLVSLPDSFPGSPHGLDVVGLARHDVAGIVVDNREGRGTGVPLTRAGRLSVFAVGYADATSLRVFSGRGSTIERLSLTR